MGTPKAEHPQVGRRSQPKWTVQLQPIMCTTIVFCLRLMSGYLVALMPSLSCVSLKPWVYFWLLELFWTSLNKMHLFTKLGKAKKLKTTPTPMKKDGAIRACEEIYVCSLLRFPFKEQPKGPQLHTFSSLDHVGDSAFMFSHSKWCIGKM